jgi:hypothetical protein
VGAGNSHDPCQVHQQLDVFVGFDIYSFQVPFMKDTSIADDH